MTTGRINQPNKFPEGNVHTLWRDATRTLLRLHPLHKACSHLHSRHGHTGNPLGQGRLLKPQVLLLCHIFPLLHPSMLQTYHCHRLQEDTSGKNHSSESQTLYSWPKAIGYNNHPFSVLSLAYKFGHFTLAATTSKFAQLRSFLTSKCCPFVPRNTHPAWLTLTGHIQLHCSFWSFPMPALTLVPEIIFDPDGAWRPS